MTETKKFSQEQIQEFYNYCNNIRGSANSRKVLFAKRAKDALVSGYRHEMSYDEEAQKIVYGDWLPREDKPEALALANKLLELGPKACVFGKGRVYLKK